MSDGVYGNESSIAHASWGAIWSGAFTFLAIETVFGMLGAAIFPSIATPGRGIGVGISVWMTILTIIAMYVGGRVTGEMSGVASSQAGALLGIIMFGLSMAGVLVLAAIVAGNGGLAAETGTAHSLFGVLASLGWAGFAALFLGWLAAMGGAASAAPHGPAHRPLQEAHHAV